ncbi:MAG: zinc ABC transporter substrate-binding protein [Actinomycetales bacterium]|nr:zinc ABC transporter substrate-binding protein [Actinomycetales bacterium]
MTSPHKAICVTTALVAVAGTVLALSGCAAPATNTPASNSLAVVATTTQVADFSRQIAGTAGTVTGLVQANQSVHGFDPSAKNLLDLGAADVLVTSGVDLESWLDDAIQASGFDGTVIDASTGVTLLGDDPHIWTNPANAILMVENIATGFTTADPTQSSVFEANASAYVVQLTALNEWITSNVDQAPLAERLLVTNHDAFTYFYNAYNITFVGSIIPSLDDNAEPSAAELDTLIAAIKASGAKAIFSEASLSPKLAETIAQEAGVKVYSGENALYSDSLGAAGSAGETYLSATIHNVTVLMDSWGYEASPLPATLTV